MKKTRLLLHPSSFRLIALKPAGVAFLLLLDFRSEAGFRLGIRWRRLLFACQPVADDSLQLSGRAGKGPPEIGFTVGECPAHLVRVIVFAALDLEPGAVAKGEGGIDLAALIGEQKDVHPGGES